MARLPRPDLADVAQHVVQRGNDRLPCFYDDDDRQRYLTALRHVATRYTCSIHAYVLMSNHVHLLVTPASAGAVSRMMQALGRSYVSDFNGRHRRTGTLWEGRYKSCLVGGERYVLACHRYIELNPVRAAMVAHPGEFPWSSHAANAAGKQDPCSVPIAIISPSAIQTISDKALTGLSSMRLSRSSASTRFARTYSSSVR